MRRWDITATKEMKKLLFLLIIVSAAISVTAQVCRISNSNDNVEVFSCYLTENNSIVSVTVGNDSQDNAANVTVTVEVTYRWGNATKTKTYTGRGLAKANTTTEIKISISPEIGEYKAASAQAKQISGTKCL